MKHARSDYDRIQDPAGLIPDNEPVLLLRAQDVLAGKAVAYYALLCEEAGATELAALAKAQAGRMAAWTPKKVPDLPAGPQSSTDVVAGGSPQCTAPRTHCWCEACDISANGLRTKMSLCPACGDKRCPRANHHGAACTVGEAHRMVKPSAGAVATAAPSFPFADAHKGMKVDYVGAFHHTLTALRQEKFLADLLRQMQGHMREMGRRFYAGELSAVDEFLQLYCVEQAGRDAAVSRIASAAASPETVVADFPSDAQQQTYMDYQERVLPWLQACFGDAVATDRPSRTFRFVEESLELAQACGCSKDDVSRLVDYVYGRPSGVKEQEVGGVMLTLAGLCNAQSINMMAAGEVELARVWTKIDVIRVKQAKAPQASPLPGPTQICDEGLVRDAAANALSVAAFSAPENCPP